MPNIIDSYSEANQNSVAQISNDSNAPSGAAGAFGQCFTGDGEKIVDTKWYLRKNGSPTGNAVSKIYVMTGSFGVNGNVGTLLATSDNLDVSTLGGSFALATFTFSGANQYTTTNGSHYVVSVEYGSGNSSSFIEMGYDSSGTHPGTWAYHAFSTGGVWTAADAGIDLCFYVDGVSVAITLSAGQASFVLTGQSAALRYSPRLIGGVGSFVFTGQPVRFPQISAGAGTYVFTGGVAFFRPSTGFFEEDVWLLYPQAYDAVTVDAGGIK